MSTFCGGSAASFPRAPGLAPGNWRAGMQHASKFHQAPNNPSSLFAATPPPSALAPLPRPSSFPQAEPMASVIHEMKSRCFHVSHSRFALISDFLRKLMRSGSIPALISCVGPSSQLEIPAPRYCTSIHPHFPISANPTASGPPFLLQSRLVCNKCLARLCVARWETSPMAARSRANLFHPPVSKIFYCIRDESMAIC